MTTLAQAKSANSTTHIARYEKKILEAQQAVSQLPGDDYYGNLLGVIHRPGWTTIAEGLFFEALVDTIHARARELADLHIRLKEASESVSE